MTRYTCGICFSNFELSRNSSTQVQLKGALLKAQVSLQLGKISVQIMKFQLI